MDELAHLDFDVDPVSPMTFDAFGLVVPDEHGLPLWQQAIDGMNADADQEGWDRPAVAWMITGATTMTAQLADDGLTVDEAAAAVGAGDIPGAPMGWVTLGKLNAARGEGLWAQVARPDAAAVVLRQEAFMAPADGGTSPNAARDEVREWLVAWRSGQVLVFRYRKTGPRQSAWVSTTPARSLNASLLARTVGVDWPFTDRTATPRQVAAVHVAAVALKLLAAGANEQQVRGAVTSQLLAVSDPVVTWPADVRTALQALGSVPVPEQAQRLLGLQDAIAAAWRSSGETTWVQAIRQGPASSQLLRDLPLPESAADAEAAGEELLTQAAGDRVASWTDKVHTAVLALPVADRALVTGMLNAAGLELQNR
ncbi:MAG: hypothetical protein QG597_212 [Actinomycetota bacterium]|nr:hypothetical protein [Actinomycetota bacterium]